MILMKLAVLLGTAAGTRFMRQLAGPFPSFIEHGADWAGKCATREMQSPIDIDGSALGSPASGAPFSYNYPVYPAVDVENDGKAMFAKGHGGNQGAGLFHPEVGWHDFVAVRVRSTAEHTIQGHRAQLELQLVHERPGSKVIVAVLFDLPKGSAVPDFSKDVLANYTAPAPGGNPVLTTLLHQRPPRMQESFMENATALDLKPLLGESTFIEYAGSETLPPCEGALWLVRRDTVVDATEDQIARLHQVSYDNSEDHGNWRWVQPGNARPLMVRNAKHEMRAANPPAEPYENGPAYGPYMGQDNLVFKGDEMAQDVVTIEKYVSDYAKDLDHRLQASALARIAKPVAVQAPTVPPLGSDLDPNDPLYAIKVLNGAQKIFKSAVDQALKSTDVTAPLVATANDLARSAVRTQFKTAANQTTPTGGAAMHAALRR